MASQTTPTPSLQEQLEILGFLIQRAPVNQAEALGANVAFERIRIALNELETIKTANAEKHA